VRLNFICFTAQIYNYRLKRATFDIFLGGGMAPPPYIRFDLSCNCLWSVTKGAGSDWSVRVASMAQKYGILRGYLRRVLKNLMTLTSRYSVAF